MKIVGIDPGKRGGIAIQEDGQTTVLNMPEDPLQVGQLLKDDDVLVFVEKINLRRDDLQGGKAFHIQTMIRDYERLKVGLEANGIPYVMVHPAKWQANLGQLQRGVERAERKRLYKDCAQRIFPNQRVTLLNADALLILVFGLKTLQANRAWVWQNCPMKGKLNKFFQKL